jgi:5'-nucleotidase
MDACLGLYDDMYDTYGIMKEAEDVKAPSVSTGVEPAPDVYVVVSGDSLWFLGLKFYDSGYKWKDIYESNRDVIENPSLIYPGTSLRMPK